MIGGCNDNGDTTKKTYKKKYNFDSGQWSNGSELLIERYGHACGVVENSTNLMIVVIGGRNNHQNEYFDSVQFAVLDKEGGHLNAYRFENTVYLRNNAYNILAME